MTGHIKLNVAVVLFTCVATFFGAFSADGATIPNVIVTEVSGQFGNERVSANLVNGNGLNVLDQHSTNPRTNWLSQGGGGAALTPSVTLQLPQNFTLSNLHIWNYPETARGMQDVSIETSPNTDGTGFVSQGIFTLDIGVNSGTYTGFDLTSPTSGPAWTPVANVRQVRLAATSAGSNGPNYGDGFGTGLEAIRLETTDSLPSGPAAANVQIVATVKSFSSQFVSGPDDRNADNTRDGSGLSGVFPNQLHDNVPNNQWHTSAANIGEQGYITYDLGSSQALGGVKIFPYNEAANNATDQDNARDRIPSYLQLFVSADDNEGNLVSIGEFLLPASTVSPGPNVIPFPGIDLDLSTVENLGLLDNVRLVRVKILSTEADRPDGDSLIKNQAGTLLFSGLAEVQFLAAESAAATPEPSTAVLGLLALAGLGPWVRRRRNRS